MPVCAFGCGGKRVLKILENINRARAAVIDGFLSVKTLIDLNAYNMDPSDMEELAAEIMATGEHGMFYNVTEFRVNPNPVMGTASTLSVEYEDGDLEHMQQVWERVKAVSESVITPGMREYEIAKALHDWLVLNCSCDLDWNLGENGAPRTMIQGDTFHLAYGALVKGEAVCAGYARACQALIWTQYYFISNGNQWTPEQICTSTRYDNVMPSGATEQAKQAGRQAAETRTHDDRIRPVPARYPETGKGKGSIL